MFECVAVTFAALLEAIYFKEFDYFLLSSQLAWFYSGTAAAAAANAPSDAATLFEAFDSILAPFPAEALALSFTFAVLTTVAAVILSLTTFIGATIFLSVSVAHSSSEFLAFALSALLTVMVVSASAPSDTATVFEAFG
jgi:hypothetical protein